MEGRVGIWRRLDRWFFGYGSPVTLGVLRIIFGAMSFVGLLMLGLGFDDWLTERGFLPASTAPMFAAPVDGWFRLGPWEATLPFNVPRFSMFLWSASSGWAAFLYVVMLVAALLTTIGLWTRASSIVLAVLVVSLHHRAPGILHGGDLVMRVFLMYLAIAPSGAACSVDRLLGLWRGRITGEPPRVSMWPQRLIAINVALIYFTTAWHKFGFGDTWRDGTATWYTHRLNEFHRFPVPDFMGEFPMVRFTTWGTLLVELALGTLVFWRPARKWVLLGGLGMHAYIEWSMNIPLFAFLICALYLAFYDGEEVSAWARRFGDRFAGAGIAVWPKAGHVWRSGPRAALEALDPFRLIKFQSGPTPNMEDRSGEGWLRTPALWWGGPWVWGRLVRRAAEKRSPEES